MAEIRHLSRLPAEALQGVTEYHSENNAVSLSPSVTPHAHSHACTHNPYIILGVTSSYGVTNRSKSRVSAVTVRVTQRLKALQPCSR